MTLQWRQFNFVDRYTVSDPADPSKPDLDVTSSTSGRGHLFFGDAAGSVYMVDHTMAVAYSFQAYHKRVTHLKMLKQKNVLVTIGDEDNNVPTLKVWNMDKTEKGSRSPVLARSTKLQHGNKVFPVTAFAVLENMTQIAVGMENGVVILVRGDISRDRFTKQKTIHEGSECITGLGFREDGKSTTLYIITLAKVLTCITSNKDIKQTLDEHGCDVGCAILTNTDDNQEMVIGRREAVYFYGPDGRGPCFIIDDDKVSMTWFRGYVAIVSSGTRSAVTSSGSTPSAVAAYGESSTGTILTLYDLKNKYIAYTGTFGLTGSGVDERGIPILCVLSEWGELLVVTRDKKMFRLEDKDLSTKLDLLFKKNMYTLAINIVTSQTQASAVISGMAQSPVDESSIEATPPAPGSGGEYDYGTVVEIYRRYGDHLYAKGEFDAAMAQYLMTAGQLEPSYVIRKFLDAQRIHNLTSYLSRLHELGLAGPDHTTLLLNCYTKLRDARKLYEFIRGADGVGGANFDVETAIRVCRQAGYHEHALWLAEKHGQHDLYLAIQVEDLKEYSLTVRYLATLSPIEATRALKRYGTLIVKEMPKQVADLLVKLCTSNTTTNTNPEQFIHLFVGRPEWCIEFLERVLDSQNHSNNGISPVVASIQASVVVGKDKGKKPALTPDTGIGGLVGSSPITPPAPPERRELSSESMRVICNTLLELYLDDVSGDGAETLKKERQSRAMDLLRNPQSNYDVDHALVLCEMHSFSAGTLFLYEKMGLHSGILQYYIDRNDVAGIIDSCKKYGDKDSSLWTRSLAHFAEQSSSSTDAATALTQVLDQIDRRNLLPPLGVVQVLARNSSVTLGMVRDYLIKRIENEKRSIDEDQKVIRGYKEETDRMRAQIDEFKNKCAPDHRVVKELVATQEANHGKHDVFLRQLDRADDKFALIAEYFSKSPFGVASGTA
ncbi:hypothetical protein SmJEL517_g01773 [Synchytrium microbalum]|uniref:E3 ubiquitin-protein ligase PEP5 n=1 Tax=Synchytrium microbalum TaxID=1806994 RepID=A0A507C9K5_9FUNG|nr:uncharacterized protein SmJEL517_g01773 [Synchytrium microbalum]TPX36028.1 hypothetical protein SmJEL517_g01773 [Synchytrium microbalum]